MSDSFTLNRQIFTEQFAADNFTIKQWVAIDPVGNEVRVETDLDAAAPKRLKLKHDRISLGTGVTDLHELVSTTDLTIASSGAIKMDSVNPIQVKQFGNTAISYLTPDVLQMHWSDAVGSRAYFQTTTLNGATWMTVLPNGTSQVAFAQYHNKSSDLANSGFIHIGAAAAEFTIRYNNLGTATALPFRFYRGTTKLWEVLTDDTFQFTGTAPPKYIGNVSAISDVQHITTKAYVDNADVGFYNQAQAYTNAALVAFLTQPHSWTATQTFTVAPQSSYVPSGPNDLTSKAYVDNVASSTLAAAELYTDNSITTLLSTSHTWGGVQTFTNCPQTSCAPSTNDDIVNKLFVDTSIADLKLADNVWVGLNEYNTVLPQSSLAPTLPIQLVNKAYVDQKFEQQSHSQMGGTARNIRKLYSTYFGLFGASFDGNCTQIEGDAVYKMIFPGGQIVGFNLYTNTGVSTSTLEGYDFVIRKNGADTAISISLRGTQKEGSSAASFSVTAGDLISIVARPTTNSNVIADNVHVRFMIGYVNDQN